MSLFGPMFKPANCFGAAIVVFFIAGAYYHSTKAGLCFAAIPAFFGFTGLLSGK